MTPKLKKADVFACNCVISSHRIMCNTCIESFYEGLHFFFLHWWAMSNIWGHYDLKTWKFDDSTMLCAVWFTSLLLETYLWSHELINICWPSRLRWRSNWNLLTVACNCSILVIIIIPSFPNRPLLAKISETTSLSVTKVHTHVDPYLLSCTRYFLSGSGLPFWI